MDKGLMIRELQEVLSFENNHQFAEYLGISPQTLSNWKSRGTFDIQTVYTKCVQVNPHWLLTGEGPMLKTEKERTPGAHVSSVSETGTGVDTTNIAQKYEYLFLEVERLRKELKEAHKEIGRLEERLKNNEL